MVLVVAAIDAITRALADGIPATTLCEASLSRDRDRRLVGRLLRQYAPEPATISFTVFITIIRSATIDQFST